MHVRVRTVAPGRTGPLAAMFAVMVTVLAACGAAAPAGSVDNEAPPAPTRSVPAGGPSASPTAARTAEASPARQMVTPPVAPGATAEGYVDVDGHAIYARCSGTGSPTVVYFTGWALDDTKLGVEIGRGLQQALAGTTRVCAYERRNTGRSDSVPGEQTAEDLVEDVDGVLEAMGEDGPFVLLGASFGGLVASAYAVAHPDRVAGIVLLDASTGVEHDIAELHGFQGACLAFNRAEDATNSVERIDNCGLAEWVRARRDQEPEVPLLYLAAEDPSERGDVADDPVRQAWVESWSPGTWRVVDEPHWMDESDPYLVAEAVREVIAEGATDEQP